MNQPQSGHTIRGPRVCTHTRGEKRKHPGYRTPIGGRTASGALVVILALAILANCSSPKLFTRARGEIERQQVDTYPYDFDTVWKSTSKALSGYRFHTLDRRNGVILTWWKSAVLREVGAIPVNDDYMHGVKIEDRSDSGTREGSEFEVQNRVEVRVIPDSANTTTVIVKNVFKVTTYNLYAKEYTTDRFANKVFSPAEFDTREEYRILRRIREIAGQKKR